MVALRRVQPPLGERGGLAECVMRQGNSCDVEVSVCIEDLMFHRKESA